MYCAACLALKRHHRRCGRRYTPPARTVQEIYLPLSFPLPFRMSLGFSIAAGTGITSSVPAVAVTLPGAVTSVKPRPIDSLLVMASQRY